MASVTALPARYAKFITALAGVAIAYLTAYGTTWNLQGALVSLGAALAVFGVPNAQPPVVLKPAQPPPGVTMTPPATDRPTGGITPPPPASFPS